MKLRPTTAITGYKKSSKELSTPKVNKLLNNNYFSQNNDRLNSSRSQRSNRSVNSRRNSQSFTYIP